MADPNVEGAEGKRGLWQLGPGGWSVGEDPVPGMEGAEGWPDALKAGGYTRYPTMRFEAGRWGGDYHLSVYEARESTRFLVCLAAKGRVYKMLVEDLPLLIDLVNKLIPVVRLGCETQDKEYELRRRSESTEGLS